MGSLPLQSSPKTFDGWSAGDAAKLMLFNTTRRRDSWRLRLTWNLFIVFSKEPPNHPSTSNYVANLVQSALSHSSPALASNPTVYPSTSVAAYQSRLESRSIPLDTPSLKQSNPGLVELRKDVKKSRNKARKKGMTAKERRTWGAWEVPKNGRKFDLFVPMWQLWGQYMRELMSLDLAKASGGAAPPSRMDIPGPGSASRTSFHLEMQLPKLIKADYHGAYVTVVKSRCPGYVGLSGIVVRETENTFVLCPAEGGFKNRANRLKGGKPAMVAVVSKNPAEPSALPTADSAEFFLRETTSLWPSWKNEQTPTREMRSPLKGLAPTLDEMDVDAEDRSDSATAIETSSSAPDADIDDGSSTPQQSLPSRSSTPLNSTTNTLDQFSREARRAKLFEILSKAGTYISILTTNRPLSMEANAQRMAEEAEREKQRKEKEAVDRAERSKLKEAEMAEALKNRRKGTRSGPDATEPNKGAPAPTDSDSSKPLTTTSTADKTSSSRGRKRKSGVEEVPPVEVDDQVDSRGPPKPSKSASGSNTSKRSKPRQPRYVQGGLLREYQLEGVEWLQMVWENGLNGILADEMGLGKTIQTISFLAWMKEKIPTAGPFLIVAPLSVLDNWVDEIKRFTPDLPVVRYHGTPIERTELRNNQILRIKDNDRSKPIVVTSYDIILNDRKWFQNLTWYYMVVDEGHRIKNMNCKLIRELKQVRATNRLLLTGTPLQNNLAELWSLLNFILPEIFDSYNNFLAWFDIEENLHGDNDGGAAGILEKEEREGVVSNLHTLLRPFMLRRCKTDVETTLPSKKEYIVYAPLVETQRKLYTACLDGPGGLRDMLGRMLLGKEHEDQTTAPVVDLEAEEVPSDGEFIPIALRRTARESSKRLASTGRYDIDSIPDEDLEEELEKAADAAAARQVAFEAARGASGTSASTSKRSLNSIIVQLRKVCQHPFLFPDLWDKAANEEADLARSGSLAPSKGKGKKNGREQAQPLPQIVAQSGKMYILERMLPKLFEKGHKVLIFSQWVEVLNILQEYCETYRGWTVCRLDGSTKLEDRKSQMNEFNTDPNIKIFLLSTRAGGLGINLVAADTVIIFDSDWNPQADLQAQDRAHRIGQTKPVVVYRFVTENTVEAKILQRARAKRKLEKIVMKDGMFRDIKKNSDRSSVLTDIAELLMRSDQETISSDSNKDVITPESILPDDVLQKILRRDGINDGEKDENGRFEEVEEDDQDTSI
ncbi:hypothetical protein HDU93_008114 [Gonapodya sp. JEL0774]|nr:hypothetical protein HDU93_008114 [Gonapodya sp. JEL0774]